MKFTIWLENGTERQVTASAPDVGRILRACIAERQRTPGRMPGQTERLCRMLLDAHVVECPGCGGDEYLQPCSWCGEPREVAP